MYCIEESLKFFQTVSCTYIAPVILKFKKSGKGWGLMCWQLPM